jgi:hypothetical protein
MCDYISSIEENHQSQEAKKQVVEVRSAIIDQILEGINSLDVNSQSAADKIIMEQSVSLLPALVKRPNFLNDLIFQQVVDVLDFVSRPKQLFGSLSGLSEFRQAYGETVSCLWFYIKSHDDGFQMSGGRSLQGAEIGYTRLSTSEIVALSEKLIRAQQVLLDSVCDSVYYYDHLYSVSSDFLDLAVLKYRLSDISKLDSLTAKMAFGGDELMIPLGKILEKEEGTEEEVHSVCLQGAFYK